MSIVLEKEIEPDCVKTKMLEVYDVFKRVVVNKTSEQEVHSMLGTRAVKVKIVMEDVREASSGETSLFARFITRTFLAPAERPVVRYSLSAPRVLPTGENNQKYHDKARVVTCVEWLDGHGVEMSFDAEGNETIAQ